MAAVYVKFVSKQRVGFDLVFARELGGLKEPTLAEAGRTVMDTLLRRALELSRGDANAALKLLERIIASAHGYATLHLSGFMKQRIPDVEEMAAAAAALTRILVAEVSHQAHPA